eukprot:jgi/Chlat1/7661/Chrsp64S00561
MLVGISRLGWQVQFQPQASQPPAGDKHASTMKRAAAYTQGDELRSKQQRQESDAADYLPQAVAHHYSARENVPREQRLNSPILHLKSLNNWIKSVLIHKYVKRNDAVLDWCCGKGGDFMKFEKARISYYVGVDIAQGSVYDAADRYNKFQRPLSFPAKLYVADTTQVPMNEILTEDAPFDVCNCQFAFHYAFANEGRVRKALRSISSLMRPGVPGLEFGNSIYHIRFDDRHADKIFPDDDPYGIMYAFTLADAVSGLPEYLVHFETLAALAEEYGLELVLRANFHEFFNDMKGNTEYSKMMQGMSVIEHRGRGSRLSYEEWDAAYLYLVFAFKKTDTNPPSQPRQRPNVRFQPIDQAQIPVFT